MSKVLILCLENCGHHAAARAIEAALRARDSSIQTLCVDPIRYSHPRLSSVIHRAYMGILKGTPELWEALYDNEKIDRLTQRVRWLMQKASSESFLPMIQEFQPDAIVCTQAYSFGAAAAYREKWGLDIPLFGVITDYRPHRFWVVARTGVYIVPTSTAAERLVSLGVDRARIRVYGIPVSPTFIADSARRERVAGRRRVLWMGGSYGLGITIRLIRKLDRSEEDFTMDIVCGMDRSLRRRIRLRRRQFRHPIRVRGFVKNVADLMGRSALLISKPGGMSCAEALIAGLPMVIVKALPGQEAGNTLELVRHGVAWHVKRPRDLPMLVGALLSHGEMLSMMRARAGELARPDAADRIAVDVLDSIRQRRAL